MKSEWCAEGHHAACAGCSCCEHPINLGVAGRSVLRAMIANPDMRTPSAIAMAIGKSVSVVNKSLRAMEFHLLVRRVAPDSPKWELIA